MAEIKDPENTIIMTLTGGDVVIALLPDVAPEHTNRMKNWPALVPMTMWRSTV
jgi:peptidylprolyl isomerase/peptidyl-prolyl cis-trans isomerase B (cyclophilin B)